MKQPENTAFQTFPGISAFGLRLLASIAMVLDHSYYALPNGQIWLVLVGRIAFPIYAFLAGEGYRHTKNLRRYCQRLLLVGVLSELPFNLICSFGNSLFYPEHQNVLFTMLLGLLTLRGLELAAQRPRPGLASAGVLTAGFLAGTLTMVDYGGLGVLTVVLFGITSQMEHRKSIQLIGLGMICWMLGGAAFPLRILGTMVRLPIQLLALLALPLIWLYRGRKGWGGKRMQWFWYWFYPGHLALLYGLGQWIAHAH